MVLTDAGVAMQGTMFVPLVSQDFAVQHTRRQGGSHAGEGSRASAQKKVRARGPSLQIEAASEAIVGFSHPGSLTWGPRGKPQCCEAERFNT